MAQGKTGCQYSDLRPLVLCEGWVEQRLLKPVSERVGPEALQELTLSIHHFRDRTATGGNDREAYPHGLK